VNFSLTFSASVSTTSSASPPLGAASILTALAQPAPPKSTTPPTPTTSEPAGHAGPTPPRRTALKRSQSPGSPRSLVSDGASILSEYGARSAHNSSRSFPRIHQPTVVRRKSGKGVAFLPPPAQVSPTTSGFAIHQPSHHRASMPAGSRHDLEKIRSAGRSRSLSRPAVSDARRPEARTGLDEMMRTGVIRVDPKGGEVEPVQYGGGPASDDVTAYSDDQVREPKMPELGRVVGLREDDAKVGTLRRENGAMTDACSRTGRPPRLRLGSSPARRQSSTRPFTRNLGRRIGAAARQARRSRAPLMKMERWSGWNMLTMAGPRSL
jgi:hypothetical protein